MKRKKGSKKEKHTRPTETKTKKTTKKRRDDDDEEEDDVDHDHVPLLGKRDDDEGDDGLDSDEDIPQDLKPKRGATKKPASAKGGAKKKPSTKRHKQDPFCF